MLLIPVPVVCAKVTVSSTGGERHRRELSGRCFQERHLLEGQVGTLQKPASSKHCVSGRCLTKVVLFKDWNVLATALRQHVLLERVCWEQLQGCLYVGMGIKLVSWSLCVLEYTLGHSGAKTMYFWLCPYEHTERNSILPPLEYPKDIG